ncbi:MAG: alpha/beta hydrolase [Chloroflexi bacterium]|nr:alpha/beta hydrolase [Chloroflexota bacterium]
MDLTVLDNPIVQSLLFYPREDRPGGSRLPNVFDGTIPVADEIVLGYRLYAHTPGAPVILYFHGNGEVASDHDHFAQDYHLSGASLLVVDYRGYGWSTGAPKVSALMTDVEPIMAALPEILARAGLSEKTLVVMGRSLGSVSAIHTAHAYPDRIKGLIIESGFAHALPLLARLGIPAEILANLPDPMGNIRKIAEINLPLLVIHGERDNLIPVSNGQALYDASPAVQKRVVRVPGAGHNDLLFVAPDRYFGAVAYFLTQIVPPEEETP